MSEQIPEKRAGEDARARLPVGRKLPENALWSVLERRAQPLALEFCSWFFAPNSPSYAAARKWLAENGIKISKNALHGFYNSMDIRLKFASLQAQVLAENSARELPADLEQATRDRVAQTMFELCYVPMGQNQRLQLIALQQNADGMKGNFALKKAKLDLDREKFKRLVVKKFLDWHQDKVLTEIASSGLSQSDKIERLGQAMFGEDWGDPPT